MSNIKRVTVYGALPFNSYEYEPLNKYLGIFNSPVYGLRIDYTGGSEGRANEFGGETYYYYFFLTGLETVRVELLNDFCSAVIASGGWINEGSADDIENNISNVWLFAGNEANTLRAFNNV